MNGPRGHPRQQPVSVAAAELKLMISRFRNDHEFEFTDIEWLSVVAEAFGDNLQGSLRGMLRFERHGDYETPAGWAPEEDEKDEVAQEPPAASQDRCPECNSGARAVGRTGPDGAACTNRSGWHGRWL